MPCHAHDPRHSRAAPVRGQESSSAACRAESARYRRPVAVPCGGSRAQCRPVLRGEAGTASSPGRYCARFRSGTFIQRTGRKLRAIDETVTRRVITAPTEPIAQDATNRGPGPGPTHQSAERAQLFIAPQAVEWHCARYASNSHHVQQLCTTLAKRLPATCRPATPSTEKAPAGQRPSSRLMRPRVSRRILRTSMRSASTGRSPCTCRS